MDQSQLLGHCGSNKLTREQLGLIPSPEGTDTYQPLAHHDIVEALLETLTFRHIGVVRDEYAVSEDGMKMFGVLDLETSFDGCRFSIGLRNSNPAGRSALGVSVVHPGGSQRQSQQGGFRAGLAREPETGRVAGRTDQFRERIWPRQHFLSATAAPSREVRTKLTAVRVLVFATAFAAPLAFGAVKPWA